MAAPGLARDVAEIAPALAAAGAGQFTVEALFHALQARPAGPRWPASGAVSAQLRTALGKCVLRGLLTVVVRGGGCVAGEWGCVIGAALPPLLPPPPPLAAPPPPPPAAAPPPQAQPQAQPALQPAPIALPVAGA